MIVSLSLITNIPLPAIGKSIDDDAPLTDTSTSSGRMYLAILGGLAEIERELIARRTAKGRARSTKRMGRPLKLTSAQRSEALQRRASGEPLTEIARLYNVSHMTIQRLRTPDEA